MTPSNSNTTAHLAAFLTILWWGTTFVSMKVLLQVLTPVQILLIRFCIGFAALYLLSVKSAYQLTRRQNLYLVATGFLGICLYYLLENIALTYTQASNVGVIMSVSPFFTAIFSCVLLKEKLPSAAFFIGFCLAIVGIYLLSFSEGRWRSIQKEICWSYLPLPFGLCIQSLRKKSESSAFRQYSSHERFSDTESSLCFRHYFLRQI